MLANLRNLSKNPEKVATFKVDHKLHITELTREMCKNSPKLLKFFRKGNQPLDRIYIPQISKERYEEIAKTEGFKKCLKFEEAEPYYLHKARIINFAELLGVKASFIDAKGYIWDDRYYTCYNFWDNVDEVDEAWKSDVDERLLTAKQVYIDMDTHQAQADLKLVDQLVKFCNTLINNHIAMIVGNVDKCLGFIEALTEFTDGWTRNCTKSQVATLNKYLQYFIEMSNNKELQEFVKNNNDITVFAECESTHNDYIETYARFLSKRYTYGEYLEGLIVTEEPYLYEIVDSDYFNYQPLSGTYLENYSEDEDFED